MTDLVNKNVLVLGGSRGIGAAIVRRFATGEQGGVHLCRVARRRGGARQGGGAEAIQADSADRDAVIDVVKARGALDVLVVNAGVIVFGDAGPTIPTRSTA